MIIASPEKNPWAFTGNARTGITLAGKLRPSWVDQVV
jgi:hypothetical protein